MDDLSTHEGIALHWKEHDKKIKHDLLDMDDIRLYWMEEASKESCSALKRLCMIQ